MTDRANAAPETQRPLPREVWLLSLVSFFADVSSEMIYPLVPLFLIGTLHASVTTIGGIEGAAVLLVALLTATTGIRSDRAGRRVPWIRLGYGLPVIGKAMIAVATGWGAVLAGRMVDRCGKGVRGAPRDALIAAVIGDDQRGRAFGLHRAFDTAGALLGVLLSAALLWWLAGSPDARAISATSATETPPWVYRTVFTVAAALGLASFGLTLLVGEAAPPAAVQSEGQKEKVGWRSLPRGYWAVLGTLLLFSLANSSDAFLLLQASRLGLQPWGVVLAYALYNLLYASISYPAGALSDRIGRWGIIALGWAIYAVVYGGFAVTPGWGIWPLMALYGVYMGLTDGVGKALIADHAPREGRGTALGLFGALSGLSMFAGSLGAGLLWDRVGPWATFALGAACAASALCVLPLVRRFSR